LRVLHRSAHPVPPHSTNFVNSLPAPDDLFRLEYLEANGLGGWASATLAGASSRRYHGVLVAALEPPVARRVIVAQLTETLWLADGQRADLHAQHWSGGTVSPGGHYQLTDFQRDLFPVWEYAALGIRLRRTIAAVQGENTTLVLYEVLEAPERFTLDLTPLLADRDIHALTQANGHLNPYVGEAGPATWRGNCYGIVDWFAQVPGATFVPDPQWHFGLDYPMERERGLEFYEDLFAPGRFSVQLEAGQRCGVMLSTINPAGRDAFGLLEKEGRRREKLLADNGSSHVDNAAPARLNRALVLAADQFVVRRGRVRKSLIAGYPWFADWGRDALISLPGLLLQTGRAADARLVLETFISSRKDGLLPNSFPDQATNSIAYNAVDPALWLFVALHHYARLAPEPEAFLRKNLPVLGEILAQYAQGTHFHIHVDPADNLLSAGESGVQLTWMDAKLGEWVVTARLGKVVEINALWYNAQLIYADLLRRLGGDTREAAHWVGQAETTRSSFINTFWNEDRQCLFDYVEGRFRSASIRPNQLLAVSLPHPILSGPKAKAVVRTVEEHLLTPRGLRTLAPGHPDYKPTYQGDQYHRDAAYHQGTVWAWLLGPFCDALIRTRGEAGKKRARQLLLDLLPHIEGEGIIGSISEVFDATAPHRARGCPAQAWSVGEVLRVWRAVGN
jgi:predicted glycogen debranching enzyme